MIVFPAVDIWKNKVVRLFQGDYHRPVFYRVRPLEMALRFESAGFDHVHIVDLEGALTGQSSIFDTVEEICRKTKLKVDVGGGIRTLEDAERWLDIGVNQINMGSSLVKNPSLLESLLKKFSSEKIIFSADLRDGSLYLHGWTKKSSVSFPDLINRFYALGLQYISCTDISRDGTRKGINAEMFRELMTLAPLHWVAGGGISSLSDIESLHAAGLFGCIIGRSLYEDESLLEQIGNWYRNQKERKSC